MPSCCPLPPGECLAHPPGCSAIYICLVPGRDMRTEKGPAGIATACPPTVSGVYPTHAPRANAPVAPAKYGGQGVKQSPQPPTFV